MINNLDEREIHLIDFIFKYKYKNKNSSISAYHYENELNLDLKEGEFEYLYNRICEIGKELDLFTIQSFNDQTHRIITFNKIQCDKFIKSGGFKNHFGTIETTQNERQELTSQIKSIISGMTEPWYSKPVFWIPVIISILALFKDQIIPNDKTNNTIERSEVITIIDSVLKASPHRHENPSISSITTTSQQMDSTIVSIDSSHLIFKHSTSN